MATLILSVDGKSVEYFTKERLGAFVHVTIFES